MAEFSRQFLMDHGVPDDQVDAIMAARNKTLNDTLSGYVAKADVQAQIDAAVAKIPKPEPVDPKTTPEYMELARERDMLRAIGGDEFQSVKPKFRETVWGMIDRGENAAAVADQLNGIKEKYEEYFVPAHEPEKDQPKNTPMYSQKPGTPGNNNESDEDKIFRQLSENWK